MSVWHVLLIAPFALVIAGGVMALTGWLMNLGFNFVARVVGLERWD